MRFREVNLLGGFYKDSSLPWSAQDTVNWLPVPAQAEGARSAMKLRGVPGLKALTPDVSPLPQWTRWSPATILGEGATEDDDRTFYRTGTDPTTAENEATTGFARIKGAHAIVGPKKYYFEIYSDLPRGTAITPFFGLRAGLCRKDYALNGAQSGNDVLIGETAWKYDFIGKRGATIKFSGVNALNAGVPSSSSSAWMGVAVETVGSIATTLEVRAWHIIDGNWAFDGQTPLNTPTGSTGVSGSFNSATVLGGIVPYAAIYRPRSVNPEYVARANFGQLPFRIGNAAFEAGGPLFGFTKGWPSE